MQKLGDTRVKINFREGTVEIEGSEEFVEKHWPECKELLENISTSEPEPQELDKQKKEKKGGKSGKNPITIVPLEVDLKGKGDIPSLKNFYAEKSPTNNQEKITIFAYYLKKYCKISEMKLGQALSCFIEMGIRKPNVYAICLNTITRKGWIEKGSEPWAFRINRLGENLVEHDLPHPKK